MSEMPSPARLFLTHRKSADMFRNNQGWGAGGLFLPLEGCGLQAVGARESKDAKPLDTFTILTTEPNELMRPIHNRMPVILKPGDYAKWLEPGGPAKDVVDLLKPYDADVMEAYPVSTLVNSPRNDLPECVEPASES
jgi:putative SOS response-associated peptidase YedK